MLPQSVRSSFPGSQPPLSAPCSRMAAATDEPSADEWQDLNVAVGMSPHLTIEDALNELVMNAVDANRAMDNVSPPAPDLRVISPSTVELRDQGSGLAPESFVLGYTEGEGKASGRFGIGLKDAVAVLMREQAEVKIDSASGSYRFEARMGKRKVETIHVQNLRARGQGTCITVSKLPTSSSAAETVEAVKARFLCFTMSSPPLHVRGGVEVRSSEDSSPPHTARGKKQRARGARRGRLYINGVAVTVDQPLILSYNFNGASQEQSKACNRDHSLEPGKFGKLFKDPIDAALQSYLESLSLPDRQILSDKPSCEFAWPNIRALCYPKPATTSISAHPLVGAHAKKADPCATAAIPNSAAAAATGTSGAPDAAEGPRTQLSLRLRTLAELPSPPPPPKRPLLLAVDVDVARSGVAKAIDQLIEATSKDDAVPAAHKKLVDRLSEVLQVW